MIAIVWLAVSVVLGIVPLLAIAGLFVNGLLFTVDGLFMSLILLVFAGIFLQNAAASLRRLRSAKPEKAAATPLQTAQAAAGMQKGS
jgi:hypothetical protein